MGTYESDKKNARTFSLKFSLNTDADIIAHLNQQENKQSYIKRLIRADIAANSRMQESSTNREESAAMTSIDIYVAGISETLTDGEYQMGEISTCEYGEEWDGNVQGYVENMMDGDELEMRGEEELGRVQQNFGGLAPIPGSIVVLCREGKPVEIYWASSQPGE